MAMRAIEANTFAGYGGLRQIELPEPQPAKDRVLVRVTAAGVTPLEYTVLSGGHPRARAPLVLGNEGAGVIEDAGDSGFAVGSRVMFTGPYGVGENGTWQEWLLVRPEVLKAKALDFARQIDELRRVLIESAPKELPKGKSRKLNFSKS
jgi:NADPH:quinone reductase